MGGQTDEHPGVGIRQSRRRSAGMLDRPPRRLQQDPVLRVHQPDLARRHAEERRVEPGHVIDETRPAGHDLAGRARFGVEELVDVPAVLPVFRRWRPGPLAAHPRTRLHGRPRKTRRVTDDRKTEALTADGLRRMPCRVLSNWTGEDSVAAYGPDSQQNCWRARGLQVPLRRRCRPSRTVPQGYGKGLVTPKGVVDIINQWPDIVDMSRQAGPYRPLTPGDTDSRAGYLGLAAGSSGRPGAVQPRRTIFCASGKLLSAHLMSGR